jgi:hypothetical protein
MFMISLGPFADAKNAVQRRDVSMYDPPGKPFQVRLRQSESWPRMLRNLFESFDDAKNAVKLSQGHTAMNDRIFGNKR